MRAGGRRGGRRSGGGSGSGLRPRAAALLLALLLLPGALPAGAQASAPVPIEPASSPLRHEAVRLRVQAPADRLGPELLANGGFDQGYLTPWRPSLGEGGTAAHLRQADGHVRIEATRPEKAGTLFLAQNLAASQPGHHALALRLASVGSDPMQVSVVLRERDDAGVATDTVVRPRLDGTVAWTDWSWTPQKPGTQLQAVLRFHMEAGKDQAVVVDHVSLRLAPTLKWDVGDGRLLSSGGLGAEAVFGTLGAHAVSAEARDGAGASSPVAWRAAGTVAIANAPPTLRPATSPAAPLVDRPFTVEADAADPDGGLRLDPDLRGLGAAWRLDAREVGGVRAVPGRDGATLALATEATANGTVYLWQTVPVHVRQPATLAATVRDNGELQRYVLLLRERNATGGSTDTAKAFPPSPDRHTALRLDWVPRNDTVEVAAYLRVAVAAGQAPEVELGDVRLRTRLEHAWTLDGQPVAAGPDGTLALRFTDVRPRVVGVSVRDADGGTANATLLVQAADPGLAWSYHGDEVVPLAPPATFSVLGARRADAPANLLDGDLAGDAWTLRAGEVGDAARAEPWAGEPPFARLRVVEPATGSVALLQGIGDDCLRDPCRLSFEYRAIRGEPVLEPILRAVIRTEAGKEESRDVRWRPPVPAGGWATTSMDWDPPADAVRLQVFLRFLVAGAPAAVDFRNVRLETASAVAWSFAPPGGGPALQASGPIAEVAFQEAGTHALRVGVRMPDGVEGNATGSVDVLPVRLARRLDGDVAVLQAGTGNGSIQVRDAAGTVVAEHGLGAPLAGADTADPPAGGALRIARLRVPPGGAVALAAGGHATVLDAERIEQALPLPSTTVGLAVSGAGARVVAVVTAAAGDPTVVGGTVEVLRGGDVVASRPASLDGSPVRVELPPTLSAQGLQARVRWEDAWGGSFTAASAEAAAPRNDVLLGGVAAILLVVVAVLAGVALRLARRRP